MAKSKSKIPVRRPYSNESRIKQSHQLNNPSDLRRISSDLSKPKIRNNEDDENSVHSLDVDGTNLKVRRFTVTIKDSKGEFVKRRKSYKLTYDKEKDGGDEYAIEKDSVSDTSVKEVDHTQDDLKDLSNNDSVNGVFEDTLSVDTEQPFLSNDQKEKENSDSGPTVPENVPLFETETSQTIFTDDTSLPTLDDETSESNVGNNDNYTRDNSAHLRNLSPISGTTIRLLTPKDRNETNILFQNRSLRKIATVRKAASFVSKEKKAKDTIKKTYEAEYKTEDNPILKEGTSNSLPPSNFKTNLFNRVRKISTPRRIPKFSPVLNTLGDQKHLDGANLLNDKQTSKTGNVPQRPETTFVKDSSAKRFERVTSSESVRNHYDKKLKRVNGAVNSNMDKNPTERYETVNLDKTGLALKPKRHRRSLETSKGEGKSVNDTNNPTHANQNSGLMTKSAIFNKQVLKNQAKTSQHNPQENVLLKTNHYIETSKNDIFSEHDKRSRLKQAQYINDDLRIVKTKLQDSEFVAQHIDTKLRETIQKKNVLSILNKNSVKKETEMPYVQKSLAAQSLSETYRKIEHKQPQSYQTDSYDEILGNRQTNITDMRNENRLKNVMLNAETSSRKDLERKQNIWQVQPKIHRFNSNKVRNDGKNTESNYVTKHPNHTSSVAAWVLHSARGANRKERPVKTIPTSKVLLQSRTKVLNNKWKLIQTKEIQRKQKQRKERQRKDSQTKEVEQNLINAGMYLPLGRKKLKRRPKRLRPRLYTQVGKSKGYESEIPVLLYDSDEDDQGYPQPRPFTDNAERRFPNFRRYEGEHDNIRINYRNPAHKRRGCSNGALVRFFRNGDAHHKGLSLTVNKDFKTFETLLFYLSDHIPTPTGIHHIFKWPEGDEIKSVTEFQNRCVYIVSSTKEMKRKVNGVEMKYGQSREGFWSNKKMSAGRMRKHEAQLYKKPKDHVQSPIRNLPVVVTIINNLSRDKREKIILNPQTKQAFEDWLEDISNPTMPVMTLFSDSTPYPQIKSFSQLFREHQANSNFIACGDELKPLELMKKRQASSSNSSTDSIGDSKYRKKKLQKQQDMGQIHENGRPESPTSTAMSRYDMGPRYSQRGRMKDSRQSIKDTVLEKGVELEVDGVFKEFFPPSCTDPKDNGSKPGSMLNCEWVYGFRGRDTRHNLMVLPQTEELVYYVASIVVLYDKDNDTQRHYIQHNEEITCMTIHPSQCLVATGQMHGKQSEHASHIRIWDGVSLSTHSVIGLGVFHGGVVSIGFSQDKSGIYMCALDGSEKHMLSVWDWDSGNVVARTMTSTDAVHSACFYPDGQNTSILITYGARHIYFWKIFYDVARTEQPKILRDRKSGIFEEDVPMSINCIAFLRSGDVVTGDSSGHLMVWDRGPSDDFTCKHAIQAHNGSVMSLCLIEDGTLLSAAENEIKAWDTYYNFRAVKRRPIPLAAGDIMTLVPHVPGGSDGRLYVGTTKNAILDGSLQHKFKYVVQGHTDGVWCVAPHQIEPTFFSAGFDQVVYKWGLTNHKVIWRTQVEHPCTSLATVVKTKTFDLVAVGTATGTVHILHAFNGMNITTVKIGEEPIGCLAFSHDEVLLAMGCNDGFISVFHMPDRKTFNKIKVSSTCHKTGVQNLDWSKDGRCIQSSSFDNELMFWNTDTMDPVEVPVSMRNVEWSTLKCPMSYSLIGPWSTMRRGEVIKVVSRSPNKNMCVTGDSKGRVRLYKYPCTKERAAFRNIRIYSSDVTAVAFSADSCAVFTCGGNDAALVQWELIDE
ncbi:uncharacterized protein LOC123526739 isoform X2 [Mercenaria mercenaria]|uniref:uncharacterized protein LOC123526739 isoform X2 n=1 Tax=Mercenaria mercenaria TaxID=6596 RepID=UPI00234F7617|nr:uncharacterized protein LOC123526739 isoform X2 [Mercenaria mercenaria]